MSNPFKRIVKQYLSFSRSDRNAILILSALILIVVIANIIIGNLEQESSFDSSGYDEIIADWNSQLEKDIESPNRLFSFDPNIISRNKLDSLLLPEFIKRNIVNYRNAGGKFKSPVDIRKIYGMTDSIYKVIMPYVKIEERYKVQAKSKTEKSNITKKSFDSEIIGIKNPDLKRIPIKNEFRILELNAADSTDLVKISGIGPTFARRIIKYRNLLGGYYSKNQLLEVYGFPEETYVKIKDQLAIDTVEIKKIRINFAEFSELLRHPYLDKRQVKTIIDFRTKNGSIDDISMNQLIELIEEGESKKVRPYFSCR